MPIYEYICGNCQAHVEQVQKITDPPLAVCPVCGGPLRKKISLSSFQFKGSGWYATDYARKNGANGNGRAAKKAAETETAATTETKPADATPAKSEPAGTETTSEKK
jgi:putative FmdB family regulatory protein